ncbi:hypothetical protein DXG01_014151 [Tephrocybe rancida]|nr:hypothetical protein DXG01_014151 [Tephrocybe rancida]
MTGMNVSLPLDHAMDTVRGGSGSGATNLNVLTLWELVVRQAAILETFKEDCHKEQEALGNELQEAQSVLREAQMLANICWEGDLEWACLENTIWSQNEDVRALQHRVMDEHQHVLEICRDHWVLHNSVSWAWTLMSAGLSILSPEDCQAREHFQDALEELDWRLSGICHINALHTGHFVIPSDAELFTSLFDYSDRDDLDQVMLREEAAEYFEEHHGDSGCASQPRSPGLCECYWEEGEAGPSQW